MTKKDTQALLAKYDYAVPRYTSFPTAVQFNTDVSGFLMAEQVASLNSDTPVSLYIHIPFCHSLCHYCGCHTKIVNVYDPIKQYIDLLLKEIDLVGQRLTKIVPVSRIHFGGGSPNYAHAHDIKRIISALGTYFDLSGMQLDMECDPRLLTCDKIKSYKDLGLSRISLGIQDFDIGVQRAINRIQPYDLVKKNVQALRQNGIDDINFDLIIGLPCQTISTVEETVIQAISLSPSRIAVFPYAHVPWMKKHQKLLEKYNMPCALERFDMAQLVREKLTCNGYAAIGIDHFSKKTDCLYNACQTGQMRRNFQGYTDDPATTIIGFGLSSISQFEGVYCQNTTDAPTYKKFIQQGQLPVSRGLVLNEMDKMRRHLIETLMCSFTVDLSCYPAIECPTERIASLEKDGLLTMANGVLTVTEKGKPFTRVVAACFDPYFDKGATRHAKAV